MSNIVERVARALREDDAAELDRLRVEANSDHRAGRPMDQKSELDCRELIWLKQQHGWVLPEGADIDRWLEDARVRFWALEEADEALK
jgi:hypothetical protein